MQPQEPNNQDQQNDTAPQAPQQKPEAGQQSDLSDMAFSSEQTSPQAFGQVFTPGATPPVSQSSPSSPTASQINSTTSPNGPIISGQGDVNKKKFRPSKKLALLALLPLFLVGGAAAAYFGYVLPNNPEYIWKTALVNTGHGLDKIPDYVSSAKFDKSINVKGSFKVNADNLAVDGSIDGNSDDNGNSEFSGAVSASGVKLNYDVRTIATSGSNPDLYFKVNGLDGLGDLLGKYYGAASAEDKTQATKMLNGINNQWYFVDHTLLDEATNNKDGSDGINNISKKDINDFISAISGPSKKYIFTSDQSNAAIEMKQFVGKENQDGLELNHYKVAVNKENLKKWNKEVCDNIKNNKLFKTLSFGQSQADLEKDCYDTSDIDKLDSSKTADAWVDLHTKLIHNVRITDSKNSKNYVDIIQNFKGGTTLPFAVGFVSDENGDKTSGLINFEYDKAVSSIKINGSAKAEGNTPGSGSFSVEITPNTKEVKVEKPAGAKNIMQLANDLGLSSMMHDETPLPSTILQ
jgi:hypothetical protein